MPLLSFLFAQSCVGGEENVTSRSGEELLLVSQHDMATGERAATENAWMIHGHQRGCVLACRLHELAKVLFQTHEAEGTEYTRVPGVHTAEDALRELVRVNVSGRDFTRPLGATATSMRHFDMSSSMRVKFFFIADVFCLWYELPLAFQVENTRRNSTNDNWPIFWIVVF